MSQSRDYSSELINSIAKGDVKNAKIYAEELAKSESRVVIDILGNSQHSNSSDYKIKVCIEIKHCMDATLYLTVKKSINILNLKKHILEKFAFPIENQRWIFRQRILKDEEVLKELGEIDLLYLYLTCNN